MLCTRLVLTMGEESGARLEPGNDLPAIVEARTALQWAAALGPAIVIGTGFDPQIAKITTPHSVDKAMVAPAAASERILGRSAVHAARANGRDVSCRSVIHTEPCLTSNTIPFQARA